VNIRPILHKSGVLYQVRKPIRYLGGEYHSASPGSPEDLSFLLAFPDIYDIGMSHLGLKILYEQLNSMEGVHAQRAFLPWVDMHKWMIEQGIPLYGLEGFRPAQEFDVIGITLQYELSFPGALEILRLSGIALRSQDRDHHDPLILGGGPCAFNPEPLAPFFDAFLIGEGEEAMQEIVHVLKPMKGKDRRARLDGLSRVQGIYIPDLHTQNQTAIPKRLVNFSATRPPLSPVIPFFDVVHNRAQLEPLRGCYRGCKFCHAFAVYRPYRERKADTIVQDAKTLLENTGYDEISLLSLSTLDHSEIRTILSELVPYLRDRGISLSIPSTRADRFGLDLAEEISSLKKSGLTIAPEAGSQRLRDLIHKNLTEEDILSTVSLARQKGWRKIKLYFMVGLPQEEPEDLDAIVDLIRKIRGTGMKDIRISVAGFVPKPHTPFQYEKQATVDELYEKFNRLMPLRKWAKVEFHDPYLSFLEGIISRGDRKLAPLIQWVQERGGFLEAWKDLFDRNRWFQGLVALGLDPETYTGHRNEESPLPWDRFGKDCGYLTQNESISLLNGE